MSINTVTASVTTTGADGSAAGVGYTEAFSGYLLDIYYDFHASAPNTTDVAVTQEGRTGNVHATSNTVTDVWVHPRASLVTTANAAITDGNGLIPVNGRLAFTIAQANALTNCLVATIRYVTA